MKNAVPLTFSILLIAGHIQAAPSTSPATRPSTAPSTNPATTSTAPTLVDNSLAIRDDGHFFSAKTLESAQATIERIHKRLGKQVQVETYEAVPNDRRADFDRLPRAEFFRDWLADRARTRSTDGVFILVCHNPGRLQVAAGKETRRKEFTQRDVDELNTLMAAEFRKHDFDKGLTVGVEFIEHRMAENMGK